MKISLLLFAGLLAGWCASQFPIQAAGLRKAQAWRCTPCGGACDADTYTEAGTCAHCGMALVQAATNSAGSERAPALIPSRRNVAILVYKNMEILDFAGPSEVFSVAGFNVYTVAVAPGPLSSQGFVIITPNYTLANCPPPDIVVVPGGDTEPILSDPALVKWVQAQATHAEVMLSVCTGAGLLGKAGLLDGKQVTTYHDYLNALQRANPKTKVLRGTRYVDNGQIITTAGISAGIDGSLHVVANLLGEDAAQKVAQTMEYDKWQPQQGLVVKTPSAVAK